VNVEPPRPYRWNWCKMSTSPNMFLYNANNVIYGSLNQVDEPFHRWFAAGELCPGETTMLRWLCWLCFIRHVLQSRSIPTWLQAKLIRYESESVLSKSPVIRAPMTILSSGQILFRYEYESKLTICAVWQFWVRVIVNLTQLWSKTQICLEEVNMQSYLKLT
jgi:hypothetical protein